MIGFAWMKDPADEMWHVPIQGDNFKTMYLCKKCPSIEGNDVVKEMSGNVRNMAQLPGKVCENCILEEIVIEIAR